MPGWWASRPGWLANMLERWVSRLGWWVNMLARLASRPGWWGCMRGLSGSMLGLWVSTLRTEHVCHLSVRHCQVLWHQLGCSAPHSHKRRG